MNFIEKDAYTIEDIQSLIDIQAEENTYYEFKDARAIDDKQKAEISKDVSAFANADGGVIIYGLNEDRNTHKAVGLSFVDTLKYSKEWLENVIHSNIHRKIDNLRIYKVDNPHNINESIYIVKIPRSSNAPHMSSDNKFYKRANFKVIAMEEYEVRDSYYRTQHSVLEIYDWYIERVEVDNISAYSRYTLRAFVRNVGKTVENQFKLNINFSGVDISLLEFEGLTSNIKAIGTHDGYRFSLLSNMPIYPEEIIELDRFTVIVPLIKSTTILSNTKLSLELYFGQCGRDSIEENTLQERKRCK